MKNLSLEFRKRGKQIEAKDAVKVGKEASAYLETLGFMVGNLDFDKIKEYASESLQIYFQRISELITSFSGETRGMFVMLDDSLKIKASESHSRPPLR